MILKISKRGDYIVSTPCSNNQVILCGMSVGNEDGGTGATECICRCTMRSYILDFLGACSISNILALADSVCWIFVSENMATILIH